MKRILSAAMLLMLLFSLVCSPAAHAAPVTGAIGKSDFVIKVGSTSIDLLTTSISAIQTASGKSLAYKGDDSRNNFDYHIPAKEAAFYTNSKTLSFPTGVDLTKSGSTARGIKIGSTEKQLLAAYQTNDIWDDGNTRYYYFQAPNAPSSLSSAVSKKLKTERPVYFYKLIITVNKKAGKVTSILYTAWYDVAAPAPAPIGFDDFTLKLEKGSANILTENFDAILRASGKKFTKLKQKYDGDYGAVLKTKNYSFYIFTNGEDVFPDSVDYTKSGVTPRGIKIGSTETELVQSYPKPLMREEFLGDIYYAYGVPMPRNGLTTSDIKHLDDMRPIYYYNICFIVSMKTGKVTDIAIMQMWAG